MRTPNDLRSGGEGVQDRAPDPESSARPRRFGSASAACVSPPVSRCCRSSSPKEEDSARSCTLVLRSERRSARHARPASRPAYQWMIVTASHQPTVSPTVLGIPWQDAVDLRGRTIGGALRSSRGGHHDEPTSKRDCRIDHGERDHRDDGLPGCSHHCTSDGSGLFYCGFDSVQT